MVQQLSTNTFGVAKWIVSATASDGTHTTIASAITAASSGDTIFVRDGTYTENLTLKAGVNIAAFTGDAEEPTVTIIGKATASTAGTMTIANIRLQTNSDFFLVVSGTAATIVNLTNCYLNCTNNTGISSTSTLSSIFLRNCISNLTTTGIALFSVTAAGGIEINKCNLNNTGNSTTASTTSSALVTFKYCFCNIVLSTSSGGSMNAWHCLFEVDGTTPFTSAGTGTPVFNFCSFGGGTASAVSIGAGTVVNMWNCRADSSNTNAITGAGELRFTPITFTGNSNGINVTTLTPRNEGPVIKNSKQPLFSAYNSSVRTDVTGDGTLVTPVLFDTEISDQASNFASNTFTAPYTGQYYLITNVVLQQVTAAMSITASIVTTARGYVGTNIGTGIVGNNTCTVIAIADMTAGDTAIVTVQVSGGTKVVDIYGDNSGNPRTYFQGYLIC